MGPKRNTKAATKAAAKQDKKQIQERPAPKKGPLGKRSRSPQTTIASSKAIDTSSRLPDVVKPPIPQPSKPVKTDKKKIQWYNFGIFCEMADKGGYERPAPPSEETDTETEAKEEEEQHQEEGEKDEFSVKETPPKKDWQTNMLQDDHYAQLYAICNESKAYQLEYYDCANIPFNELKEAKVENKETQMVSRMRPLFAKMVWKKGGNNLFVWDDKQFIFYKQKEMPLGAITKCCLSICYITRSNRPNDNGPEPHWCPAQDRWFAPQEVRFIRRGELETELHDKRHGTREFGTGYYFQNLWDVLTLNKKIVATKNSIWEGRLSMVPKKVVVMPDDRSPLQLKDGIQIIPGQPDLKFTDPDGKTISKVIQQQINDSKETVQDIQILADEGEQQEQQKKSPAGNLADPLNTTLDVNIAQVIMDQQKKNAQLQGQGTPETHSLAGGCQPVAVPVPPQLQPFDDASMQNYTSDNDAMSIAPPLKRRIVSGLASPLGLPENCDPEFTYDNFRDQKVTIENSRIMQIKLKDRITTLEKEKKQLQEKHATELAKEIESREKAQEALTRVTEERNTLNRRALRHDMIMDQGAIQYHFVMNRPLQPETKYELTSLISFIYNMAGRSPQIERNEETTSPALDQTNNTTFVSPSQINTTVNNPINPFKQNLFKK